MCCFVILTVEGRVTTEAGDVVMLKHILIFLSGAGHDPPFGFTLKPTLQFRRGNLAKASTCSPGLLIPLLHSDYATFKHFMTLSLMGHNGFGVV